MRAAKAVMYLSVSFCQMIKAWTPASLGKVGHRCVMLKATGSLESVHQLSAARRRAAAARSAARPLSAARRSLLPP